MMKVNELLSYCVDNKIVTPYKISKETGVSQSTIGRILKGFSFNPSTEKILMDYLLQFSSNDESTKELVNTERKITNNNEKGVPYYENIDGTASITTSFSDYPETPAFYIDYEHFNDCSAYIQVVGDSMYPAYCSGEIIAVKRIMNFDVIQWGEAYFVITNSDANDMKTIKQLHFHEDYDKIILRSSNPNYKGDTVVNKKDILFLYIVKGKIRRNQL